MLGSFWQRFAMFGELWSTTVRWLGGKYQACYIINWQREWAEFNVEILLTRLDKHHRLDQENHLPPKLIFKVMHIKFWEKFWLKPLFMPVDRVIGWTLTGLFDFYLLRKLHRRTVSTVLVKFNQQSRLNDQLSIVIANFISSTLLINLMSVLSMFYLLYYNEHI